MKDDIILFICGAAIVALAVFLIVALIVRFIRYKNTKPIEVRAVITDKNQTDMSVIKSVSLNSDRNANVLVFDVGGEKLDFLVSKWVYGALEVGMSGTLTYRDTFFISFIPDETEEKAEDTENQ